MAEEQTITLVGIINAVHTIIDEAPRPYRQEIKLAIYVKPDIYCTLKRKIQGQSTFDEMEFYQHSMIMGYKVYIAEGTLDTNHPDYQIVEIL